MYKRIVSRKLKHVRYGCYVTILYMSKRGRLLLGGGLILMVLLFVGWFFFIRSVGPIPRTYRRGLDFALYYPTRLPNSYTVDGQSFKRKGNVLIFSILAPNGKNIAVSEQALPPEAASSHQTKPLPVKIAGEGQLTTNIGSARVSLWSDKYVADIVTDETWIILNVSGFTEDQAFAVAQSFTEL